MVFIRKLESVQTFVSYCILVGDSLCVDGYVCCAVASVCWNGDWYIWLFGKIGVMALGFVAACIFGICVCGNMVLDVPPLLQCSDYYS